MKAVIYARYSTESQREESIEGQIRECTEYAARNGITLLRTYIDRALSARTADRPEFQRMIADSEGGLFDAVLVWKLDRFSRDRYDSTHYKHILKKHGVRVISAKENISDGPEGIILESMLEGYAEYYSAELSQKIQRGQYDNAMKCKEDTTIPALQQQLRDCEKGIENILNAIQMGILTVSTKERLEQLEQQRETLKTSILQAQIARPQYSKEQIVQWISRFKYGNINDKAYNGRLSMCLSIPSMCMMINWS